MINQLTYNSIILISSITIVYECSVIDFLEFETLKFPGELSIGMKVHVVPLLLVFTCDDGVSIPLCHLFVSLLEVLTEVLILFFVLRKVEVENLVLPSIYYVNQQLFVDGSRLEIFMVIRHQEGLVISHELPEVLEVALIFFNHLLLTRVILRGLLSNLSIEVIFSGGDRSLPEIHETTYGGEKPLVVKSNELVDILTHEADVPQWNSALLEFSHIAQEVQPVQIDVPLSLVQDQHEGGLVEDFCIAEETIIIVAKK